MDQPDPDAPLTVESHKDATVFPTTPFPRPKRKQAMRMGVLDRKDRVVKASQLWRSYGRMGFPPVPVANPASDRREVIYAGHLPSHFGHFILEGTSRLWFAAQHPELPVAWGCNAAAPATAYARWQSEILEVLGVRNEPVFVAEPTRFGRVHVPAAGFRIKDFFSRQLADFLAVYPSRPRDPASKIWLSRTGVKVRRGSVFAQRLDDELAEHGWAVVHPERLPIDKQLELLASAGRVAAEEGSALHLLLLLADLRGLQVDILCRRPDRPPGLQNANYQTIAERRGFEQRLHIIPEERVLSVGFGHVQKVATTLAGHLEALGIARSAGPPDPGHEHPVADLVLRQAPGADSYLELGTGTECLYGSVPLARRDVVRPRFTFDPRRVREEGLQLYEMPFSEFFDYCADAARPYDVIVLDGLDAVALGRWFEASLAVAHRGTTWLVSGREDVIERADDSFAGFDTTTVKVGSGCCVVVRRAGAGSAAAAGHAPAGQPGR